MKEITQQAFQASRPEMDIADTIGYCLRQLDADHAHTAGEEVVNGLTYEELIGALLQAHDFIHKVREIADDGPARNAGPSASVAQF